MIATILSTNNALEFLSSERKLLLKNYLAKAPTIIKLRTEKSERKERNSSATQEEKSPALKWENGIAARKEAGKKATTERKGQGVP